MYQQEGQLYQLQSILSTIFSSKTLPKICHLNQQSE